MARTRGADSPPRADWGHPLMGHLPLFRADPLGFIENCAREHGDFVGLRFGPLPAVLVTDPGATEEVLIANQQLFRKDGPLYRVLRRFLGEGPLVSDGDVWQRQRALLQPAFDREYLRAREPEMRSAVQRWAGSLADGQERDLSRDLPGLVTAIVARTFFDAPVSDEDLAVLDHAYSVAADQLYRLGTGVAQLAPKAAPLPANLQLRSASRQLDRVVYRIIRQRRAARAGRTDLLSVLPQPRGADGGLTDRQLRDVIVNFFSSARETGVTLAWAWSLLAQHPQTLSMLESEVGAVLAGRPPTGDDLARLPTARGVVQETLRLYPAGPLIARQAVKGCRVGGHRLRKGAMVFLAPWVTHRDARYFSEPRSFLPGRWTDGLADRLPPFVYLPFGAGPRACLARSFAPKLCAVIVAALAQEFRFTLVPGQALRPVAGFAPRPQGGLRMIVHRRRGR